MKMKFLLPVIILSSVILGCSDNELKLNCKTLSSCIESDVKITEQLSTKNNEFNQRLKYDIQKTEYIKIHALEEYKNNLNKRSLEILLALTLYNYDITGLYYDTSNLYSGFQNIDFFNNFEISINDVNNYILQTLDNKSYKELDNYVTKKHEESYKLFTLIRTKYTEILNEISLKTIQINNCFFNVSFKNFEKTCRYNKMLNFYKTQAQEISKPELLDDKIWQSDGIIAGSFTLDNYEIVLFRGIKEINSDKIEWDNNEIVIFDKNK